MDADSYANGDNTCTIIKTEKGKTILIEHGVTTPRPYSRMYQITGTEGFANKYPNYSFAVKTGNVEALQEADIYNLDAETYVSSEVRDALVELHDRAVWSFMRQWRNAGSDS